MQQLCVDRAGGTYQYGLARCRQLLAILPAAASADVAFLARAAQTCGEIVSMQAYWIINHQ